MTLHSTCRNHGEALDRKLRAGRFRAKRLANELDESLALCQGLPAVVGCPTWAQSSSLGVGPMEK